MTENAGSVPVDNSKDLRVIFTGTMFAAQRHGGVSRYFCDLKQGLDQLGVGSVVLAPIWRTELLKRGPGARGFHLPESLDFRGVPRLLSRLSNLDRRIRLPLLRHRGRQVLHPTYYPKFSLPHGMPTVITVYDMIHERFAEMFTDTSTQAAKRAAVLAADAIIAISHHTKQCLIDIYDVNPDRITVVHLGVPQIQTHQGARHVVDVLPPFVLYVGSRSGYKNFSALLDAFARSGLAKQGINLLAFGGGRLSAEERQKANRLGVLGHLIHLDGDDATLVALYQRALALVYPSLDEGFGLPPLEAMANDCPVIAARAGAIPEVVDTAAHLFDPTDVDDIGAALVEVVTNHDVRRDLIEAGRSRTAHFTLERQAYQTLGVYRQVCN
jgi:glycosyltransferase involved in cell wall biosynthesis